MSQWAAPVFISWRRPRQILLNWLQRLSGAWPRDTLLTVSIVTILIAIYFVDILYQAEIGAINDYVRGSQDNFMHSAITVFFPEKIRIVTIHEPPSPGVFSVHSL
ncbi:hypothetical protein [Serratia plymuthica]